MAPFNKFSLTFYKYEGTTGDQGFKIYRKKVGIKLVNTLTPREIVFNKFTNSNSKGLTLYPYYECNVLRTLSL